MSYIDELSKIYDISFDKILRIANDHVPASRKNAPWIGLEHGVKLLANDDELAQYLAAYGQMHREKITAALDTIQTPTEYFSKELTIVDWGCGQGLATICFFDYLHTLGFPLKVNKVILVEPSRPAINRAVAHVLKYISANQIQPVNKYINDVTPADVSHVSGTLTVHFFSNILDIPSVNLEFLSNLIQGTFKGEQLLFCVGPQNIGSSRIAEFAQQFDISDEDLIGESTGRLSSRGTIRMMVFHIKSSVLEIIKVEYYRRRSTDLGNNTALKRILSSMTPSTSLPDKAMQFYRAAVALERMKSADIKTDNLFYFPYTLVEADITKFNIDIQDSPEFEQIFKMNSDRSITKWPKNLNIGLSILYGDIVYRLFEYVYPFDDLKYIDITTQYITVDLPMFTVSSEVAEKLELTEDIVDAISATIQNKETTLSSLEDILVDALGPGTVLYDKLSLALTAEAPALSQINSELKELGGRNDSAFLSSFLSGSLGDNIIGDTSEDEILSVVDMDDSQRHAIQKALNSKVSVVTGPPGTGKTQMIVNLLANAIYQGKSVLVASKNNKAVDNIKDRFDSIDNYHYLVRFGSKDAISKNVVPYLDSMMASIPNIGFIPSELNSAVVEYNRRCDAIAEARKHVLELVRLSDHVPEVESEIQSLIEGGNRLREAYKSEKESFEQSNSEILPIIQTNIDWDSALNPFLKNQINLQAKNSGISKFFFNMFSKKKYNVMIQNDVISLPSLFRKLLETRGVLSKGAEIKDVGGLLKTCNSVIHVGRSVVEVQDSLQRLNKRYQQLIANNENLLSRAQADMTDSKRKIALLTDSYDSLLATIANGRKYISSVSMNLLRKSIQANLAAGNTRNAIARYKNYLPNSIPWRREELPQFVDDSKKFINAFKINAVTSLSVKGSFPLSEGLFDMVIIDEASQCDIASALPLIYRAKQLVVIGDPLQLKHITSVTTADERIIKEHLSLSENPMIRYADQSLWDYCDSLITSAHNNNTHVVLDSHYRCHPQIIGYSNELFYQRKLGTTLRVCTKKDTLKLDKEGIIWVNVKGTQFSDTRNVNVAEVKKAISLATSIAKRYQDVSIGIISPFKHQAEEINRHIPDEYKDRIVSDTVHKFQGDERDVIIYSLVVSDGSPDSKIRWIDTSVPNLVNVAVTRARSALYVLGNREYIQKHSRPDLPLGYLVQYTEAKEYVTNVSQETIIVDTNIFVNHPDVLDLIDPTKNVVISEKVVDDLEKLKITLDDSKKRNVELAIRNLNRIFDPRRLRMECADFDYLPPDFSRKNPDNMILSVALKYRNQNPTLLTENNCLQLKAKGLGIKTISKL